MNEYREYKQLNLPEIDREILEFWEKENVFKRSIAEKGEENRYVFYEGPPSANGMPGIHHVMSRTVKDLFCRYHTMLGKRVERKAGWDTHGLPIELGVEKELGIRKEDIGTKITVEEYNSRCREAVMRYTDVWNDLTRKMGYWVDLEKPYVTYENGYIVSLWFLLKEIWKKNLLYKGYTIQPYSPAAGTGLSTHELNQPGCYKNVKDTTIVAQFKVVRNQRSEALFENAHAEVFFLAWTTTPWTLPSNSALAVGPEILYAVVNTFNSYTGLPITVVLAQALLERYFPSDNATIEMSAFSLGDKKIPYRVIATLRGNELEGMRYEQLLPFVTPDGDAFRVIQGDFVSTEDGTGIVHIAPTFGADDYRVAAKAGIPAVMVKRGNTLEPLVDKRGRFVSEISDPKLSGKYVKLEYLNSEEKAAEMKEQGVDNPDKLKSVDVWISIMLKEANRAFLVEKYEHTYPHCWRTDKPVLYYPLDSWFIKTTAIRERMIELNKSINWKPESTGSGRFGNWLENLQDWNLSRSRFWGTPLPVWRTEDGREELCIGSFEELQQEVKKSIAAGCMEAELTPEFDLHKPYIDRIILCSPSGKPMRRELDLIDVWFDSGAMPFAQWHSASLDNVTFRHNFPADFIAEGVDQTRGWFFTLHAIAALCFDSIAYKNVVSNGLVLDKNGHKMSKRLGNVVNPFETIASYGADATRWYIIANSQPWDNLRFDIGGIEEVKRKFFGTLFNTYSFFAMYANVDGFTYSEDEIPTAERPEIDRWILSSLHSLMQQVRKNYDDYEPTLAARAIQDFTDDNLSNWYVRLCRRRFWKGDYSKDKISAYQTLYTCLDILSKLMAPIAPFFSDFLSLRLQEGTGKTPLTSVHLSNFPQPDVSTLDPHLERRMLLAQQVCSLILSIRKKQDIKVRIPLQRILIPVLVEQTKEDIQTVESLILSEVNVKMIEYVSNTEGIVTKKIKPNFKALGAKLGDKMKQANQMLLALSQAEISFFEEQGNFRLIIDNEPVIILLEEVEILSEDIPGWQVASLGKLTVALDINVTQELREEGNAREFVNKIQNLRKEKGFYITDRISVSVQEEKLLKDSLLTYKNYICAEILAEQIEFVPQLADADTIEVNEVPLKLVIKKR